MHKKADPVSTEPSDVLEYGVLHGFVGYALRRAHNAVFADFARATHEFDISPGQLGLLILVEANPGINAARLAREIGLDKSTLTPFITRFEKRGLMVRKRSETDKRAFQIEMTDFGRRFLASIKEKVLEHERRLQSGLGPQKTRRLIALLGEAEQVLNEQDC